MTQVQADQLSVTPIPSADMRDLKKSLKNKTQDEKKLEKYQPDQDLLLCDGTFIQKEETRI